LAAFRISFYLQRIDT